MASPTEEERAYLKMALAGSQMDDPFYQARQKANPFLQSDHPHYVLIEFWTGDREAHMAYIRFLNDNFYKTIDEWKSWGPDTIKEFAER